MAPALSAGNEEPDAVAAEAERSATADTGGAPAPSVGDDGPPAFDESAESAFLAEARERGEAPVAKAASDEPSDEMEPKDLPPLDDLVRRIPAEVRETLDDLFRARFVTVKRVPKKALKS